LVATLAVAGHWWVGDELLMLLAMLMYAGSESIIHNTAVAVERRHGCTDSSRQYLWCCSMLPAVTLPGKALASMPLLLVLLLLLLLLLLLWRRLATDPRKVNAELFARYKKDLRRRLRKKGVTSSTGTGALPG
jgi:hypothetical protein